MRMSVRSLALSLALLAAACSSNNGSSSTVITKADVSTSDTATSDVNNDASGSKDGTNKDGADAKDVKADVAKDIKQVGEEDDDIAGAQELEPGSAGAIEDSLTVTGDVDWFKFTGKKGDLIQLYLLTAQQDTGMAFDKLTIDSVLSLYGPDKELIATNDDPTPRTTNDSSLLTVLPADGTYYVQVQECQTWLDANPTQGASCAEPAEKDNTDYTIEYDIADLTKNTAITQDAEKGNDAATATAVQYPQDAKGKFFSPILFGTFKDTKDIDVFIIDVPLAATPTTGRSHIDIEAIAGGKDGDGSTADPGIAWMASEATPSVILAQVDLTTGALSVPLPFGQKYFLFVQNTETSTGANDFYIIRHTFGGSNPVEKDDAANDKPAGAEVMTSQKTATGTTAFYFEGDLIKSGKDVDHYSWEVPAGEFDFFVVCGAQDEGSGLRGLTATVLGPDGTALTGGKATEIPGKSLVLEKWVPPTGNKTMIVAISADHQDDKVAGTYYRCVVGYAPVKAAP